MNNVLTGRKVIEHLNRDGKLTVYLDTDSTTVFCLAELIYGEFSIFSVVIQSVEAVLESPLLINHLTQENLSRKCRVIGK